MSHFLTRPNSKAFRRFVFNRLIALEQDKIDRETDDYCEPNEEQPYRLRDEGRNDDGTGLSYGERNA